MRKGMKILLAAGALVLVALVLFGLWAFANGMAEVAEDVYTWQLLQKRGIVVPAQVTSVRTVRVDTEGSDDTDYDLYVTYNVNAKTYTDRYWKRVDDKPVGSTAVKIVVDPVRPHVIQPQAKDVQIVWIAMLMWGAMVFGVAALACLIASTLQNKKEWPRFYANRPLTCAVVQEELDWALSLQRRVFRVYAVVVLLLVGGYLLLHREVAYVNTLAVVMGIPTALGLLIMAVYLRLRHSRSVVVDVRLTKGLGLVKDSEDTVIAWSLEGCKSWSCRGDSYVSLGKTSFNWNEIPGEILVAVDAENRVLRLFNVSEFSLPEM